MTEWMGEQFEDWAARVAHSFDDFEFACEKPPAFLTIDDRGMQFRGDWSAWWPPAPRLKEFKPWNVGDEGGRCALAALRPGLRRAGERTPDNLQSGINRVKQFSERTLRTLIVPITHT